MPIPKPVPKMPITVVGAGVGGSQTALHFARQGHPVTLIDAGEPLSGSSNGTGCRLGVGFHSRDHNTALRYLREGIKATKEFSEFIIGEGKPQDDPLRRGRYFVVDNSDFSVDEIIELYAALRNEYARLVAEDPSNMVFGPPERFCEFISPSFYMDSVNPDKVIAAFDTAEHLLDWEKFKAHLISEIESHPLITLSKHTKVEKAEFNGPQQGYTLTLHDKITGSITTKKAPFVVNAAWQNIEAVEEGLGFPAQKRTNRLKAIAEVILDEKTSKGKDFHSMFFCYGPHATFSCMGRLPDGRIWGFITYEPVTNIEQTTGLLFSERGERLLHGGATADEIAYYSEGIKAGVTQYIPFMKNATVAGVRFGNVRTKGEANIFDPKSEMHQRNYSGVETKAPRWVANACTKLVYCLQNAEEVYAIIDNYIKQFQDKLLPAIEQHVSMCRLSLTAAEKQQVRDNAEAEIFADEEGKFIDLAIEENSDSTESEIAKLVAKHINSLLADKSSEQAAPRSNKRIFEGSASPPPTKRSNAPSPEAGSPRDKRKLGEEEPASPGSKRHRTEVRPVSSRASPPPKRNYRIPTAFTPFARPASTSLAPPSPQFSMTLRPRPPAPPPRTIKICS